MDFVNTVELNDQQREVLAEVMKNLIDRVKDLNLKVKLKEIFFDYWDDICKIPASKSLRYHHRHENIYPGGMVNHLLRSLYFAKELIKETGLKDHYEIDMVTCAVMVHDLGVLGRYNKYKIMWSIGGRLYHGKVGSDVLREVGFPEEVCHMVHRHMSHWEEAWVMPKDRNQWIVAYSDYLASREEINISGIKVLKVKKGVLVYEEVKIKAKK